MAGVQRFTARAVIQRETANEFRANRAPSRWFHLIAIAMIATGLVGAFKTIFAAIKLMEGSITPAVFPGTLFLPISTPGEYEIYYENQSVFNGRVFNTGTDVPGLTFTVKEDETGEEIPLRPPGMNETYTINGRTGRAVFRFYVNKPGYYSVSAGYPDNERHDEAVFAVGNIHFARFFLLILAGLACIFGLCVGGLALGVVVESWRYRAKRKLATAITAEGPVTPPL
jgi:hypothetical protein